MPTPTYTPLANTTLGSNTTTVTFSSISQAYRDLVLVVDFAGTGGGYCQFVFNSDTTATNYNRVWMVGNGSTAASGSGNNQNFGGFGTSRNNFVINVMDYSATDKHKSVIHRENDTASQTAAQATRWSNTAAITSFAITAVTSQFAAGSTFALFGIAS